MIDGLRRIVCLVLGILAAWGAPKAGDRPSPSWTFVENRETGILTVKEGGLDLLSYRFRDQLREGVDPRFTRSTYIHPLFAPDGRILTEDFPDDHLHHHGVFWTWPRVKVRGIETQTWHPADPGLRQHFVRWIHRGGENGAARLDVENAWSLDDGEIVAREHVSLRLFPWDDPGRAVDLRIVLTAVGGPLELQGSSEANKGYGGVCWRSSPLFRGAEMTTDRGVLREDAVDARFKWADISTDDVGVAVFVAPDHPGFPLPWLVRNSYAGVINPSWPGLKPAVIEPGRPVTLSYRIYIHRGNAESGRVPEAYGLYLSGFEAGPSR